MINLIDLEKKINSELTTKINSTEINHDQLYVDIDKDEALLRRIKRDILERGRTIDDIEYKYLNQVKPNIIKYQKKYCGPNRGSPPRRSWAASSTRS